jgi:hypothetical protein
MNVQCCTGETLNVKLNAKWSQEIRITCGTPSETSLNSVTTLRGTSSAYRHLSSVFEQYSGATGTVCELTQTEHAAFSWAHKRAVPDLASSVHSTYAIAEAELTQNKL